MTDEYIFADLATAINTLIGSVKWPDSSEETEGTPVLTKVDIGMPKKIPLYKGPAAIIDLISIPSFSSNLRKKVSTMEVLGSVTLVNKGKTNTANTLKNLKMSSLILGALWKQGLNRRDARLILPETNIGAWGLLPQNRLAIRQGDKAITYHSFQILFKIKYSGDY